MRAIPIHPVMVSAINIGISPEPKTTINMITTSI